MPSSCGRYPNYESIILTQQHGSLCSVINNCQRKTWFGNNNFIIETFYSAIIYLELYCNNKTKWMWRGGPTDIRKLKHTHIHTPEQIKPTTGQPVGQLPVFVVWECWHMTVCRIINKFRPWELAKSFSAVNNRGVVVNRCRTLNCQQRKIGY